MSKETKEKIAKLNKALLAAKERFRKSSTGVYENLPAWEQSKVLFEASEEWSQNAYNKSWVDLDDEQKLESLSCAKRKLLDTGFCTTLNEA